MKIAIIGLGYVGLPLFCLLSKNYTCIGLDKDFHRVNQLREGIDYRECEKRHNIRKALLNSTLTSNYLDLSECNMFIVCVPTGVDKQNIPDLKPLIKVCESVGRVLKKHDLVVFESTVFPGAIDEICTPLLEKSSNLKINEDFLVGYSPERINIGDKSHRIFAIPKIIAGSNATALSIMDEVYSTVLDAPTIKASCIKVAEAAKMYENVQRDILIALANEYAGFCKNEGININEVTECAASKWNFMKVSPGLVGGHCIGIDPYYILQRSNEKSYSMPLVKIARTVNEEEPQNVARYIKEYAKSINANSILLLGFSYKENTPDCRNTKVAEVYRELKRDFALVDCFDPIVNQREVAKEYNIPIIGSEDEFRIQYELIVKMVPHKYFKKAMFSHTTVIDLKDLL